MARKLTLRERNRRYVARFRARLKARGLRSPAVLRAIARQSAQQAERRVRRVCIDCEEPSTRYVRCVLCRARRAENCKKLWWEKRDGVAEAGRIAA